MSEPAAPLRDVAIIGGGCYGTFYARQLETARRKARLEIRQVLVVDRDPNCQAARELEASSGLRIIAAEWDSFLGEFLDSAPPGPGEPDDAVVPSPLMPHLMASWLLEVARARWPDREVGLDVPVEPLGTPYDALGPDGNRYVSFADWICPVHCIEPLTCPMIRAPRTWEMGDALAAYTERLNRAQPTAGPALFTTRHHSFGVGMFGATEIRASRELVVSAGNREGPIDVVVGTVSACHGAMSILRFGATKSTATPGYISRP